MRRIHSKSIGPTDGWQPASADPKGMKLVTIAAIGGNVGIRDVDDTANPGEILDGSSVACVDVDLSKIELNVPGGASASVIG